MVRRLLLLGPVNELQSGLLKAWLDHAHDSMRATALFLSPLSRGVAEASHTARRAQAKRKGWRSSFRGHNRQPTSSRGISLMVSLSLPEMPRWGNLSSRRVSPSPIFQRRVQGEVPLPPQCLVRHQRLRRVSALPAGRARGRSALSRSQP